MMHFIHVYIQCIYTRTDATFFQVAIPTREMYTLSGSYTVSVINRTMLLAPLKQAIGTYTVGWMELWGCISYCHNVLMWGLPWTDWKLIWNLIRCLASNAHSCHSNIVIAPGVMRYQHSRGYTSL